MNSSSNRAVPSGMNRYGVGPDELAALLEAWGEPRYRATQIWKGLYERRRPLEELTDVGRQTRERLAEALPLALEPITERTSADGLTTKWLFGTSGTDRAEAQVETVLMRYRERATVCVSSQAGCAMACSFCATGQAGFERHLTRGEIVEQVARAQHASPQRVSNVVFMGMGEPLANLDEVLPALERIHADLGISARQITVSTVGIVPGMRILREFGLPVTLAVSVHAADDALRNEIVPVNRRYPLAEVLDEARAYAQATGRRVTFEVACIEGVNDHPHQARSLAARIMGFPGGAHVNLIPLNPTEGYGGAASARTRLEVFAEILTDAGVTATIRRNRGTEIDAACGQLRARVAGA